jgi:hypothetical protein
MAVTIRKIETPLQRMVQRPVGGIRVKEALDAAVTNLLTIEDICSEELDRRLVPLMSHLARDPAQRPTDEELASIMSDADAALTACSALNLPMLGRALIMLCAFADALRNTDYWPTGALTPAINLVTLTRASHISTEAAEGLLVELQRCLVRYIEHSRI